MRINEQNGQMQQVHLNQKNVLSNLTNENLTDCDLVKKFAETNSLIRSQIAVESNKIDEVRKLIRMLKHELITAQKERDALRNHVHVQRK